MGWFDRFWGGSKESSSDVPRITGPAIRVRYKRYKERADLSGRNLLALAGASRDEARKLFPFLADPETMEMQSINVDQATAQMIGEVADEVHEFTNAWQGRSRVQRLLLKAGEIIELSMGR